MFIQKYLFLSYCIKNIYRTFWNNNITFWCLKFHSFRYVTDATVAVFIAMLLFILPSKPPRLCFWSSTGSETGKTYFTQQNGLHWKHWSLLELYVRWLRVWIPFAMTHYIFIHRASALFCTQYSPAVLESSSTEVTLEHSFASRWRICPGQR